MTNNVWTRYVVLVICAFCLGIYAGYSYFAVPLQAKVAQSKTALDHAETQIAIYKGRVEAAQQMLADEKAKPPQIVTEMKTKTEIAYVPKETIIYKDPVTGETVTKKEAVDVDLNVTPPLIGVKYNGKIFDLAGISGESSKFENGKLVGEISSMATLDVTALVERELERKKKHLSLGGYATNQGFVGSIGVVQGNVEYKLIGKVPKIKEFYGAGVEVKF